MKTMKNDTRYIIKRIIIGVGIALILGLLKTNKVFAESVPDSICAIGTYSVSTFQTCDSSNIYSSDYVNINNDFKYYSSLNNYDFGVYNITFYNSDLELYTIVEYYSSYSSEDLFVDPFNYIGLYDLCNYEPNDSYCQIQDNTRYMLFYSKNQLDLNNNINFPMESGNIDILRNGYYKYIYITDNSNTATYINNHLYNNANNVSQTININSKPYYLFSSYYVGGINNKDFLIGNNTSIYKSYTNFSNANDIFYFWNRNNSKQEEQLPFVPSNYIEVQINGEQAVYFVPKNYETINKVQLDNVDFINFPFYYKGNLKTGFYNLKDNSQIVFNYTTPLSSESEYTSFDINFPLYYNSRTTDLCSIIFFNNNSVNSSIYYDSTLFDAYIIDNMGSYDNTISIIDENGDPQDLDIHFNKTLQEQWESGFLIGGDDFLTYFSQTPLHKFFDLITLPFTFINNLKDSTCSPIVLPVPFTNSEIRLNCLSSTFSSVLGNHYSTLRMLISGIVLYHTFLLNFYCLLDVIRPKTSFEVVDL